ncbi:SDR family NAD(P)-dependent oxidoreductase [Acidaminobacter sp. JC074]|uniref:oxidoreductase n=1 Tax=Acidaminobacter sp. JC074 TaxID=2530199 RepID=UPI001F0E66E8|nr:oxidoreductase [Acidaminobacter sp. JC074]MCH4889866.1 SDR family NAD(P)-dependent oxidoreductase [Acidaminobacter sp. JC074]
MKKLIVITGASSGLGKAAALRLIKEGHIVYGLARRLNKMKDLVQAGGHAIQLDVREFEKIPAIMDDIIKTEGHIDVLWNNAGLDVMGAIETVSLSDAKTQMDVNLFGLSEVSKAIIPHMRKKGQGLIINTSSVGGKIHSPLNAWYHASKYAVEGFSDCMRMELKEFGIKVVILEPGMVRSELGSVMVGPLEKRSKGSPYESLVNKLIINYHKQYAPSNKRISQPYIVGDLLVKIIKSNNPRTRYTVGYMARASLFMKRVLSDKVYDQVILKMSSS